MPARPRPFDWRRPLVYAHRWLGISGCTLFIMWFASGIVMMYVRMPDLSIEERLARSPPLDLSTARLAPAEAATGVGLSPEHVRIGMLADRPVYRFRDEAGWKTVFADNGARLNGLTQKEAMELARRFAPEHASTLRYDAHLLDADQWTMDLRSLLPLHKVSLGDHDRSDVYFSDHTGEAVMKTTGAGRRWAYLGAVPHWLYFSPLRRHAALWRQVVIWLSVAGCATCLSGLAWGLWRYSRARRYPMPHGPSHSPYVGLMRWHHYAGLSFGTTTFTWVFSGLLSMNPGNWSPDPQATSQQRAAVAGGPLRLQTLTLECVRAAAGAVSLSFLPKELEVVQLLGATHLAATRGSPSLPTATTPAVLLVLLSPRGAATFQRFERSALAAAARAAMPHAAIRDESWLDHYDSYYYDRTGTSPLPVLRVRYNDPLATWLYLDPVRGAIVRREVRSTRLFRWLNHGLHSIDLPTLYSRRPLWDIVILLLALGGLLLVASITSAACRRMLRRARTALSRVVGRTPAR